MARTKAAISPPTRRGMWSPTISSTWPRGCGRDRADRPGARAAAVRAGARLRLVAALLPGARLRADPYRCTGLHTEARQLQLHTAELLREGVRRELHGPASGARHRRVVATRRCREAGGG